MPRRHTRQDTVDPDPPTVPTRVDSPVPAGPAGPALIIDCTGQGRGAVLRDQLFGAGVDAAVARRLRPAPLAVLLAPIGATLERPRALADLAGDIVTIGRSDRGQRETRIVLAWYVDEAVRSALAVPCDDHRGRWNATMLLVGTAWERELAAHGHNVDAAVVCRSERIRWLLDAPNLQSVGGVEPASLHDDLTALDPAFVAAACVGVRQDDTSLLSWLGEPGLVASVRHRIGLRQRLSGQNTAGPN